MVVSCSDFIGLAIKFLSYLIISLSLMKFSRRAVAAIAVLVLMAVVGIWWWSRRSSRERLTDATTEAMLPPQNNPWELDPRVTF